MILTFTFVKFIPEMPLVLIFPEIVVVPVPDNWTTDAAVMA